MLICITHAGSEIVIRAEIIQALQSCGLPLRYLGNIVGCAHNLCTIYIYSPCMMWAHPLNVSPISLRWPYGRHAHRLWEVPKARKIARLQGCPMSIGAILRAAVKVSGQYCGRCTQSVHYIYSPCMMWAHPLNVSPMHIRWPYGRRAHRLPEVPKARNIARLHCCPMSIGAIMRAAVKVLG